MQVSMSGSVRVDLVGGTLDIDPIHLVLPDVVTINVATELKAKVIIDSVTNNQVKILSKDYNIVCQYDLSELSFENFDNGKFEEMSFVLQVINYFKPEIGLQVSLESGAPAGSGLGGSSAMGVTLYKALCEFYEIPFDKLKAIGVVRAIESRILNQGVPGYQDYYPALFGGVLALTPRYDEIKVEQLYSEEMAKFIAENLTLVFSGKSRKSGINNWEVYKSFFNGEKQVRQGMSDIAKISFEAYKALKNNDFNKLRTAIALEGQQREKLFPNIVSNEVKEFYMQLRCQIKDLGLKMCGAGGGGCFILIHHPQDREIIKNSIKNSEMQQLDFTLAQPVV
jgi:D-glycero-alpha-D-manno-heptose-7-phosphate kinase